MSLPLPYPIDNYRLVEGWYAESNGIYDGSFYGARVDQATSKLYRVVVNGLVAVVVAESASRSVPVPASCLVEDFTCTGNIAMVPGVLVQPLPKRKRKRKKTPVSESMTGEIAVKDQDVLLNVNQTIRPSEDSPKPKKRRRKASKAIHDTKPKLRAPKAGGGDQASGTGLRIPTIHQGSSQRGGIREAKLALYIELASKVASTVGIIHSRATNRLAREIMETMEVDSPDDSSIPVYAPIYESIITELEIEATDRYGGDYPDLAMVCTGMCEGTGLVPVDNEESAEPWRSLWVAAEAAEPSLDGWHFVICPLCGGSGERSLAESAAAFGLSGSELVRGTHTIPRYQLPFDELYGKAFRIAHPGNGQGSVEHNDENWSFSIVTPFNRDAWQWPEKKSAIKVAKENNTLNGEHNGVPNLDDEKYMQIVRAGVKAGVLKGKQWTDLLAESATCNTPVKRAVVIRGNPLFTTNNPDAERFYGQIADYLSSLGYEVVVDAGEPYSNTPPADLWVGHSRGVDRFRFAPPGTRLLALGSTSKGDWLKVNHPDDEKQMVKYQRHPDFHPGDRRFPPSSSHYVFTDEMRTAIRTLDYQPVVDVRVLAGAHTVDQVIPMAREMTSRLSTLAPVGLTNDYG